MYHIHHWEDNGFVASTTHGEVAAMIAAWIGDGARVTAPHYKTGERVTVWEEGVEDISAAESYDAAADVMFKRRGG